MSSINPNPPRNIDVSVREINSNDNDQQVEEQPVQSTPIELPDNDFDNKEKGNTLQCLENALLEKFVPKEELEKFTPDERIAKLDEIKKDHVVGFHGRLPRTDATDVESGVEFETYEHIIYELGDDLKPVLDENGNPKVLLKKRRLMAKMTWEIDLKNPDEKMVFTQTIKTRVALPDKMHDLAGLNYAKLTGVIALKAHRQLHKRALLGDNYSEKDGKRQFNEGMISNLRDHNILPLDHYNRSVLDVFRYNRQELLSSDFNQTSGQGIPVEDTRVSFVDGSKVELDYAGDNRGVSGKKIIGKKVVELKEGDDKKDGTKATKAMKESRKVIIDNAGDKTEEIDPEGIPYAVHLFNLSTKTVIKDPKLDAFQNQLKKENVNSDQVDKSEYRRFVQAHCVSKKKLFEDENNQLVEQLSSATANALTDAGFLGAVLSIGPRIKKVFAEKSMAKGIVSNTKESLSTAIDEWKEVLKENPVNADKRKEAHKKLQDATKGFKNLSKSVKKLQDSHADLKKHHKQLEQLGPKPPKSSDPKKAAKENQINELAHKGQLRNYSNAIAKQEKQLKLYEDLTSDEAQALFTEAKDILDKNPE